MSVGKKGIILGDSIDIMRQMEYEIYETIDLCITDPPYELTSGGCRGGLDINFNTVTKEQKESGLMFEVPPFFRWMDVLFALLKDGSHFYCMSNQKNLPEIISDAETVGFKVLNILVWDKGMHTPIGYYMQNIEFIVLFRKGKAKKINNLGSKALIKIDGIRGTKIHPSEKPVELYNHLLLNSSKENEIVIDPFAGSGTIIESCLKHKRQYIAIEKDPNHFEKMKKREDNFNKSFLTELPFETEM